MYATDFKFDGELASAHNLIICSFNGSGGTRSVRNGADVKLTTSKSPSSNVWHHVNAQYDEVLTCVIQVMKFSCGNEENRYFTVQEQETINRWLNRLDSYYPFQIVQNGYENIFFNVQINVNKLELGGQVIGFELTVTTDKPYGYFETQNINFHLEANGEYNFFDQSDEVGNFDVLMKVTCLDNGTLTVSNSLTGQSFTVDGCMTNEIISIDTENRKLSSSIRTNAELLKSFNFKWMTVGNTRTDRKNVISSTLPVDIEIVYNPICKIGL